MTLLEFPASEQMKTLLLSVLSRNSWLFFIFVPETVLINIFPILLSNTFIHFMCVALAPPRACMLSNFSHVRLCVTPWTPLSMRYSRQDHWSRLPGPPPKDLPNPEIKPTSLCLLYWQVGLLPLGPPRKWPLLHVPLKVMLLEFGADICYYCLVAKLCRWASTYFKVIYMVYINLHNKLEK